MIERPGLVTMRGGPVTLLGPELAIGAPAPEATVLATDMSPVKISGYRGKVVIIVSVPSLDTPVCDLETRRFNAEAANLDPNIVLPTISMDLPFAQKRWCGAHGVDRVVTLSDHRDASFGLAYGLLIKELRLLARAVLVLDREGILRYFELVKEISQEPDYDAALAAARACL